MYSNNPNGIVMAFFCNVSFFHWYLVICFDKVHLGGHHCPVKRGYEIMGVGHRIVVWLGHMVEGAVVTAKMPISWGGLGEHMQ